MKKNILIVDDEESVRYSFQRFLNDPIYIIDSAKNGSEAIEKVKNRLFDLIILDVRLPDMSGLDVLQQLKSHDPKVVVLIITAFGSTDIAIESTKRGAYDYILKPFDIPTMKKLIDEALECNYLMRTQVTLKTEKVDKVSVDRIVGDSPAIQEVFKLIGRISSSDVNILLRGESGTGKELVARAIYQHSNRSEQPFLAVNCAAIPETLLESELFGYERGAFTGANRKKIGKFEQLKGGTIFLDEIGDMTLYTQSKLLRFLQEGSFERLGGDQTIQVDIRIITATNRNLEKMIEEGTFREDLYYRIKVVTITLPPLRFRQQDIPSLVDYFLDKHYNQFVNERPSLTEETMARLLNYDWPGNIRELENVLKRAMVLCKGNVLSEELISDEFQTDSENRNEITDQIIANWKQEIIEGEGVLYDRIMQKTEKMLIQQVLKETSGNQVQAAKILGISRVMLKDRIDRYGIKKEVRIR